MIAQPLGLLGHRFLLLRAARVREIATLRNILRAPTKFGSVQNGAVCYLLGIFHPTYA